MDNEDELIRSLLGNSARKTAPAGLTETVMHEVRALEQRRMYRRLVLAIVLRTVLFTGVALLLVMPMIVKGIRVDGLLPLLENAGEGIVRILKNAYFLLPLLVLVIGRKLFAIK